MRKTLTALAMAAATALTPLATSAETLIFGTGNVPMHPINKQFMEPWASGVNGAADGAVEIAVRHGPALVNTRNAFDRVADDVVQMSFTMLVFHPGRFPRSLVTTLPFIEGTPENIAMAYCKLYEEGVFDAEMEGVKPLFFMPFPHSSIHLNGSPITKLDDMAGKKIMVGSPVLSGIVSAFGGTPLSINLPDQYQALQRGTADGNMMTFTAFPGFKLNEVTTDHLLLPLGGAVGMVFMDQARYDALSDDAKAALDAHTGCDVSRDMGVRVAQWEAGAMAFTVNSGEHTVTEVSDEDFQAIKAKFFDRVAEGFTSRAPEGTMVLEKYLEAVEAARAETGG